MSLIMGIGALILWLHQPAVRIVRWAVIGAYVAAEILMTRPAYYLISSRPRLEAARGGTGPG